MSRPRRKCARYSSPPKLHINDLPQEIMYTIFDYLCFYSLREVSLTCRRWERLISEYGATRFTLRIGRVRSDEDTWYADCSARAKVHLTEAAKMLDWTKRRYSKVDIDLLGKPFETHQMNLVLSKLLVPSWLEQLVVLRVGLGKHLQTFAVKISKAVVKMGCLQELHLVHPANGSKCLHSFKELKVVNRSLHKLVLHVSLPEVIDCPNLRVLDIVSSLDVETIVGKQYIEHGGEEPYWKLKQLEELMIWHPDDDDDDGRMMFSSRLLEQATSIGSIEKIEFYRHLKQLKKLYYHASIVSSEVLQAICESCVQLKDLHLMYLASIGPNPLRHLSNLNMLQQLSICCSADILSFAGVRLPRLERLLLYDMKIDWPSLAELSSIKWLKITPDPSKVDQICDLFAGQLSSQLNFLWLSMDYVDVYACLPKLSALKTLVVENVNQQFSKFLPRLPQLRRLVIFPGYMSKMTLPLRLPKRMVKLELMELGFYEIFIRDISKCMMEGDYARLSLHFREQRSILLKYSYRNVSSLR
uniref:F-box domain-containing protein n=1 Tax=Anopheles gambiae TaxID=7165 RepID=A0A453Z0P0_ANOGA